jgi:hypothetical protein
MLNIIEITFIQKIFGGCEWIAAYAVERFEPRVGPTFFIRPLPTG